jgi:hypothetical protein
VVTLIALFVGQRVVELIQKALAIYEADKTGQPDYALESAGEYE